MIYDTGRAGVDTPFGRIEGELVLKKAVQD